MKDSKVYIIPFEGLKDGIHEFNFEIGTAFFDAFEINEIQSGDISCAIQMEKKPTMLVFDFELKGNITGECGLCLETADATVEGEYRQIVKFSSEDKESEDPEISFIADSEFEIDMAPFIYEFLMLSMPTQIRHEEGTCEGDIASLLNEYLVEEKTETEESDDEVVDERWAALKALKEDKS